MSWFTDLLHWLDPRPVPSPPTPLPVPTADVAAELLELVNAARAKGGLVPFWIDTRLVSAAVRHVATMARVGKLAHEGIGDGYPWSRASAAGYRWQEIAENIAEGYPDAAAVVAGWLASPGHRANIFGPSTDFGGAVSRDARGSLYWCAVFGEPK